MNIDTDTQFAFSSGAYDYIKNNEKAFVFQIDKETGTPYKSKYDPRKFLRSAEQSMAKRLDIAFTELGSKGKSIFK